MTTTPAQSTTTAPDRDARGYFVKGRRKTGGRQAGTSATALAAAVRRVVTQEDEDAIIRAQVRKAVQKADTVAATFICDRLYGRPAQRIEGELSHGVDERFSSLLLRIWRGQDQGDQATDDNAG